MVSLGRRNTNALNACCFIQFNKNASDPLQLTGSRLPVNEAGAKSTDACMHRVFPSFFLNLYLCF